MKNGSIALAKIPQDATGKLRPVLILKRMPKYEDFLLCAITTQFHQFIDGFDLMLDENANNFADTGLKSGSIIRLGTLAVLPSSHLAGTIGHIQRDQYKKLIENLTTYLLKD